MLVVHHLDNSRSQRVLWLLEELELPYEVVIHARPADHNQPVASLCKVHPLGKAPVLADGEVVIAETGAIFEYIMDQYAQQRMQPKHGTRERVLYIHWRHFSEGSLMPYLAMKLVFSAMVQKSPWFAKPIVRMIAKAVGEMYLNPSIRAELSYINRHLAEHTWFTGTEFSAVDVLIGFQLEAVFERMATRQDYPHLASFVDRIRERPAYKAAMLKGAWSVKHHHQYWACLKQ